MINLKDSGWANAKGRDFFPGLVLLTWSGQFGAGVFPFI